MFDTGNTTHRSSVHLGPRRDFLKELMETAKREKPHIHRGTYYSLPEWFAMVCRLYFSQSNESLVGSIPIQRNTDLASGLVDLHIMPSIAPISNLILEGWR